VKILFHSNCHGEGLANFFAYSKDAGKFQTRVIRTYMLDLGLTSREEELDALQWADYVLYHEHMGRKPGDESKPVKPGTILTPMSVMYNSGYYLSLGTEEDWQGVYDYADKNGIDQAVDYAVYGADVGFTRRWNHNFEKMKSKEIRENVPESMWLSKAIEPLWKTEQQTLTMNHPTSTVFFDWANLILEHLNFAKIDMGFRDQCRTNLNIANLPCEDWICQGVKEVFGLSYGGGDLNNSNCANLARNKLTSRHQQRDNPAAK